MEFDHVGIAVRDLSAALERFQATFGPPTTAPETVAGQMVRVVFLSLGSTHLELLEPTEPTSPVGRFLETRGEGVHHVAFRVPDVDQELRELRGRGLRVVDEVGRPGARGRRVGFAHPSAFHGTLVEFVEEP